MLAKNLLLTLLVGSGLTPAAQTAYSPLYAYDTARIEFMGDTYNTRLPAFSSAYLSVSTNLSRPVLAKDQTTTYRFAQATDAPTDREHKTSLTTELGYILAMETCFTGMSYLASRGNPYMRAIAGGFDLFMGTAGLANAGHQKTEGKKIGYYLLTAGFLAKSLYNFRLGKNHTSKTRFLVNFVGYNVLVFSGYYLDSLQ